MNTNIKETMKPYLIQRAKFQFQKEVVSLSGKICRGIDSILNFDYMGSSEFEWGALPKSLMEIRNKLNEYICCDILIKNKIITVFCKNSQRSEIIRYLTSLSEDKVRLKEFSGFDLYINNKDNYLKIDFWWDIENHLMFWKKNLKFEIKFKTCIQG